MWTLSVLMAIRNTGLMELMMWIGMPSPIVPPMAQIIAIMATPMLDITSVRLRNISHSATNMTIPASGEKSPICLNISAPKVSRATGSPAT